MVFRIMFLFRASFFPVLWWSNILAVAKSETVSSVPIRILDAAEKASESEPTVYGGTRTRFPGWDRPRGPYGSYVIYDDGPPRKIFHGWNPQGNFQTRKTERIRDPLRPKPSLSYQSVYSNTIKVYEEPVFGSSDGYNNGKYGARGDASENRFGFVTPPLKPDYEVHYPYRADERRYYRDRNIPENFPKVFSPNTGFRFSIFEKTRPAGPPKTFYADSGYYRTYTINYPAAGNDSSMFDSGDRGETVRKQGSCNFIRLNGQSFPGHDKELCGRTENLPLSLPDYPDYSKFSDREIPVEHRRQNHFKAEIKRRGKRSAGYGYGYGYGLDAWKGSYSPYGYDRNYNDYYSSYYPSYNDYDNGPDGNYNYNYRNGGYRNRGFSYEDRDRGYGYGRDGGRYFGDDEYQNSQETSARGLASFLAEGGRREKSRTRNDNEQDDRDSEDSEEDYKNRRREMFNNKRINDEDDRNRRGPKRSGDDDDEEEGEEDRNGQNNYSRNFRRNIAGRRYNSRSDYHNNRYRGSSYGHNGNNQRNYGEYDRQNRPSGFYGR